jgi:hypothetical protein
LPGKGLTFLLLAVALAGCGGGGGGDGADSTSSPVASQAPEEPGERPAEVAPAEDESPAAQPPDKAHHDSGSGSSQFRQKGGDNSVPDYGYEASASEREEAAQPLHAYLDSVAAHRWPAACAYVSRGVIAELEQLSQLAKQQTQVESCPEFLAALNGEGSQSALATAAAQTDVASLRVDGDRGFVIYRGAKGQGYAMPMAREQGVWRVAALAGTPVL